MGLDPLKYVGIFVVGFVLGFFVLTQIKYLWYSLSLK